MMSKLKPFIELPSKTLFGSNLSICTGIQWIRQRGGCLCGSQRGALCKNSRTEHFEPTFEAPSSVLGVEASCKTVSGGLRCLEIERKGTILWAGPGIPHQNVILHQSEIMDICHLFYFF